MPYWTVGTPYKALEFPIIKEGRVYCWQNTNYNSYRKSGGGLANETELTSNIVLVYKFYAQANCKLPADAQDVQITVKNGELVSQSISGSTLEVCVLLRFDNTVQSIDLDFAQPYIDNPTADLNITEKNGMKITVDWVNVSSQNRFNTNQPNAIVTVTAPQGKRFPELVYPLSEWLCDINITGGELLQGVSGTLNDDKTEIRFVVIVSTPLPCPHSNVELTDQGQPETCTVPGLKEQYDCKGCAKKFVDVECTTPWTIENAIIPAGHKCNRIEHTDVAPGKDGNIEYYKCQREECGKYFEDAACTIEITLEQTIIHDFDSEYSVDNENHYHKCKNCDAKKDVEAHTFGEWVEEVAPTVDDYGVTAHKDCTVCARHFDKENNEIKDLRIAKIGTYKVTVNFGTISGSDDVFFKEGDTVTVKANAPESGKVFKGWKDESGKIVSAEKSYKFTVTKETTLTAVYEDKTSGGAIAGIVIGSVAVAGIGGFAIFWFAVKKKTFADLGVALKKGFTAMGNGIKTACRAIGNFFKNLGAKIKALFTKKK